MNGDKEERRLARGALDVGIGACVASRVAVRACHIVGCVVKEAKLANGAVALALGDNVYIGDDTLGVSLALTFYRLGEDEALLTGCTDCRARTTGATDGADVADAIHEVVAVRALRHGRARR